MVAIAEATVGLRDDAGIVRYCVSIIRARCFARGRDHVARQRVGA
jgi:hypothetical protein